MRPISLDSRSMISNVARALLWYTPFRRFMYYRYAYNFTPEQLTFFVQCINETRDVHGDIFELGCATGHTTCFLNRHLQTAGIAKDYYCIDTFGGFTTADVAFEIEKRGKSAPTLSASATITLSGSSTHSSKIPAAGRSASNPTCDSTNSGGGSVFAYWTLICTSPQFRLSGRSGRCCRPEE